MREIPHAGDTNLWRSVPTVLIIYCLISVCMENSFCGLYIQKSKTNITELSRKEVATETEDINKMQLHVASKYLV